MSQRQQLLNVSHAHANLANAARLQEEAIGQLGAELDAGLPVPTTILAQVRKAMREAKVARDQVLILLRRMP